MVSYEYECALSKLKEHFGPVACAVCDELRWGPKTKEELARNSKLSLAIVKQALRVLINFYFVKFEANGTRCEYSLLTENILRLSKYPRFLLTIRKKYGTEAEFIIKQLLHSSRMSLYRLIIEVFRKLTEAHSQIQYTLQTIKNSVCELIENNFIIPVCRVTDDIIPVSIILTEVEKVPRIDMKKLSKLYDGAEVNLPKSELFWTVNFDRFLIEFRDEIMVNAITKRIDAKAGIVMRHLLKLTFVKDDPWRLVSNPIPMMMIRESIQNDVHINADVVKYTEQYIRVLEEDSSGIIGRSGEHSGAIVVCFKDFFDNTAIVCISNVIQQKFGTKAARVHRLVQTKKFMEIEPIQKLSMLADKEAKHVAFKLVEENFLQIHELRKPMSKSAFGPNKSYFMFYVDIDLAVSRVIQMCQKALYNILLKHDDERDKHSNLTEKKAHADYVKAMMAADQNAVEEDIIEAVNTFLSPPEKAVLETLRKTNRKLFLGETQIDETIFLLQCYMKYNSTKAPETKLNRKRK